MTLLLKQHGVATELRRESTILGWVVPMVTHWRWEINPTAWKSNSIPPRGEVKDHDEGVKCLSELFG